MESKEIQKKKHQSEKCRKEERTRGNKIINKKQERKTGNLFGGRREQRKGGG